MSHCLILQHDAAFGPGRLVPVFRDYGIPIRILRLDAGDPVPADFDEVRILVLLGGPQRLSEGEGANRPAWLQQEVDAIRPLVEVDRPVLAFGLGAQILAKAAEANVSPNRKAAAAGQEGELAPHFGWGPITLPFPGGTDPLLFGLHDGAPMFFWQKDAFELPRLPPPAGYDPNKPGPPPPNGNALLASTSWCRNAAFRFKDHLYGFQFHPELTRVEIEAICRTHGGAAGAVGGSGAVDRIRAETDKHESQASRLGTRVLQNCVQYFKAYNPMGVVA